MRLLPVLLRFVCLAMDSVVMQDWTLDHSACINECKVLGIIRKNTAKHILGVPTQTQIIPMRHQCLYGYVVGRKLVWKFTPELLSEVYLGGAFLAV